MVKVCPGCTLSEKLPSKSVTVPLLVPLISTLAPIIGSPEASFTEPFTVLWAKAPTERAKPAARASILAGNLGLTCFIFLLFC